MTQFRNSSNFFESTFSFNEELYMRVFALVRNYILEILKSMLKDDEKNIKRGKKTQTS